MICNLQNLHCDTNKFIFMTEIEYEELSLICRILRHLFFLYAGRHWLRPVRGPSCPRSWGFT